MVWGPGMTLKQLYTLGPRGRSEAGYKYTRQARAFRAVPGHIHCQTNYSTRHYAHHISLMHQLEKAARPVAEKWECATFQIKPFNHYDNLPRFDMKDGV
jgi:hypothetical protein